MSKIITHETDLAIIGGGPAGLGAAIRAKASGVKNVLLIERSEELGGVLPQCIHNGFGLHYFKESLTGPAYTYKMLQDAQRAGVDFMTKTMAIRVDGENRITALNRDRLLEIRPKATILCMGCRERSFGALRIPGTRPAGIYTAGTAQRLINITLEGAKVLAVVEIMPFIGGLIRNEVQCLRDFHIPVYVSHTIKEVRGTDRIEKIVVTRVDQNRQYIPGTEIEFDADTLLISAGLIPENELSRMAGISMNAITGGPVVDNLWQTSTPGFFAGGNVVHVHDLADYASESAGMAAANAARYIDGDRSQDLDIEVAAGANIRYVVPNRISKLQETVSFYMRVTWPLADATVRIGDIYEKHFQFARPSEQIRIDLPTKELAHVHGQLIVSCEGERAV